MLLFWSPPASWPPPIQAQNVFEYPQTDDAPASLHVVNEIPAGSFTKYEINAEHGQLIVDRYVSMPVRYPANYGSITSSAGGDGDPLDALVLTRAFDAYQTEQAE